MRFALLVTILFSGLWFPISKLLPLSVSVSLSLDDKDEDTSQIFWREQSQTFSSDRMQTFVIRKGSQTLQVSIPASTIEVRLDPTPGPSETRIRSLCWEISGIVFSCETTKRLFLTPTVVKNLKVKDGEEGEGVRLQSFDQDPLIGYAVPTNLQRLRLVIIGLIVSGLCLLLAIFIDSRAINRRKPKLASRLWMASAGVPLLFAFLLLPGTPWFRSVLEFLNPRQQDNQLFPRFRGYLVDRNGDSLSNRDGDLAFSLDPYTIYRNYPSQKINDVHIDRNGFRGTDFTTRPAKLGLILGGSTAFGFGSENDGETIDGILNRLTDVHFANLGVVGHLVGQEVSTLVHYGLPLSPDYVISISGYNDALQIVAKTKSLTYGYSSFFEEFEDRLRRLAILKMAPQPLLLSPLLSGVTPDTSKNSEEEFFAAYGSYLSRLKMIANASGAEFIALIQPQILFKKEKTKMEAVESEDFLTWVLNTKEFEPLYRKFTKSVMSYCRDQKIHCVNLNELSEITETRQEIFLDSCHLTPLGNQAIALEIVKELKLKSKK